MAKTGKSSQVVEVSVSALPIALVVALASVLPEVPGDLRAACEERLGEAMRAAAARDKQTGDALAWLYRAEIIEAAGAGMTAAEIAACIGSPRYAVQKVLTAVQNDQ